MNNKSLFLDRFARNSVIKYTVTSALALQFILGSAALANPTGADVVAGEVNLSNNGSTLNVNQLSDKAIVNWENFSIANGETTNFIQPSSTSAILNKVTGGNLSEIHGNLNANGQVYLMNANGVVIGKTGVINTAGFLATTHTIHNKDFLNGGDLTLEAGKNPNSASIINLGNISASGGDIFLIADHVTNEGSLTAENGTVGLAAARGAEVLLAEQGEQKILIKPKTSVKTNKDGVVNKGSIKAINAELKAADGNTYALAINNNGTVRATGVQKKGGRILLTSKGGKLRVGKKSKLIASGKKGGGKINVGGGKQGKVASIDNAKEVKVEAGASFQADATENGNGGDIIVFADQDTAINGASLTAKGGAQGGDGGFVETSGKRNLLVGEGTVVDTRAGKGQTGNWLLDPTNFTISLGAAAQTDSGVGADTLVGNLGTSDVTIMTAAADPMSGAEPGDIIVNAVVSWDSENSLTLRAHRDITVNQAITNAGTGSISLIGGTPAPNTGVDGGSVTVSGALTSGGDITVRAGGGSGGVFQGSGGAGGSVIINAGVQSAKNLTITAGGGGGGGFDSIGGRGGGVTLNAPVSGNSSVAIASGGGGGNGASFLPLGAFADPGTNTGLGGDGTLGGNGAQPGFSSISGNIAGLVSGTINVTSDAGSVTVNGAFRPAVDSDFTLHAGTAAGQVLTLSHGLPNFSSNRGSISLRGFGYTTTQQIQPDEGDITLNSGQGDLTINHNLSTRSGGISLISGNNLTINESVNSTGNSDLSATAVNTLTLSANGRVFSGFRDNVLSSRVFINNGAADNITAPNGRSLIYSTNWEDDTRGTLTGFGNLYNRTFTDNGPNTTEFTSGANSTGNFFIYSRQPILTFTADSAVLTSGNAFTPRAGVTGLVNGDLEADAFTGAPAFAPVDTVTVGMNPINISQGTLASDIGYGFNFVNGTLNVVAEDTTTGGPLFPPVVVVPDPSPEEMESPTPEEPVIPMTPAPTDAPPTNAGNSDLTLADLKYEEFWSWVGKQGEHRGIGIQPEIGIYYLKQNTKELRFLLSLEKQQKAGTRVMTKEEEDRLKRILKQLAKR